MCHQNPCHHGGVCSATADGSVRCDCSKTGFGGKLCELGDIKIPSHVEVRKGRQLEDVTITYKVPEEMSVWASSVPDVHVFPNPIRLLPTESFLNVSILAKATGIFQVRFNTSSDGTSTLELKASDIFTQRGLQRKALPEGCFCLNVSDHQFSSTKRWYRYTASPSFLFKTTSTEHKITTAAAAQDFTEEAFFTFGIAYYVVRGSHLPMSLDGIVLFQGITVTSTPLPSFLSVKDGSVQEHGNCQELELSPLDKQDLLLAQSQLLTLMSNLKKVIAYWYDIDPLPPANSSRAHFYRGSLRTGEDIRNDPLCSWVPVSPDTTYVTFLFTDAFYFDIVGQKLKFPPGTSKTPYCLVTELVYSLTYSVQFNEENTDMVQNVGFVKTFMQESQIQISLRGFGISDNLRFDDIVESSHQTVFYNGANLFSYP